MASVALVGGAVRDMLLGRAPRELDVVVRTTRAASPALWRESCSARRRGRSGACRDDLPRALRHGARALACGEIDVAMRRTETYPLAGRPAGCAPRARPSRISRAATSRQRDRRRAGRSRGAVSCAHAPERSRISPRVRLRVLHERSFLDDPTRLLRLARYQARLGFEVEPHTAALAAAAIAAGALDTVSGARIGAELRLALAEADRVAALEALDELGVLAAWQRVLALRAARRARGARRAPAAADGGRTCCCLPPAPARAHGRHDDYRDETARLLDDWSSPLPSASASSQRVPSRRACRATEASGDALGDLRCRARRAARGGRARGRARRGEIEDSARANDAKAGHAARRG